MSKELEALNKMINKFVEILLEIKCEKPTAVNIAYLTDSLRVAFHNELDIIETALKIFETIERVMQEYGLQDYLRITENVDDYPNIEDFYELIRYPKSRITINEQKALEAFNKVLEIICNQRHDDNLQNYIDIIETALKDYEKRLALAKEYKDVNNVAKRLKALEIIKEKRVNAGLLLRCATVERYNNGICYEPKHLTQQEYDLLKEVLL